MGENSDVGKLAVEISKLYFLSINPSSQGCFNHLSNGMILIRITNIGNTNMTIYFF